MIILFPPNFKKLSWARKELKIAIRYNMTQRIAFFTELVKKEVIAKEKVLIKYEVLRQQPDIICSGVNKWKY